jgi:NAD(P)-dependent dehydrogenase (short-subunit alcohol dehydrogenase family)
MRVRDEATTAHTLGRLAGQVAIITGGSRGIGLAIAQRLLDDGAEVCITARKPGVLKEAAATLGDSDRVLTVAGKAHDPQHQADTVAQVTKQFGRIDILVNNVGTSPVFGPLMDLEQAAAAKILEVNVLSALGWTQHVVAASMREHGGAIVNMASVAGVGVSPGIGMYGVSKAALMNLTKQLAVELGPAIRVNAVAPAVVKTKFAAALYEGKEDEVAATYPLRRLGVPDDVGSVVAFLASDDSSWMTGQTLVIDGGVTLVGV